MHHNLYKGKHPYTALAVAIVLAGCNGGGDESTDSGSPDYMVPATISAQNASFITEYQDSYLVDLSDKVSVSGGKSFTLLEVASLSNAADCQPLEVMAQSFTIAAQNSKSCDYEYKVAVSEAAAASATSNAIAPASLTGAPTDIAVTRVAVTSEAPADTTEVDLAAISAVTLMEEQVEVDIKEELLNQTAFTVPDGFSLSTDLSLPYSGNSAVADPLTHSITYTPSGGFQGIERILFSYKNDTTGEVLLGTLDIAVSEVANEGILVEDNITHEEVPINEQVIIDVEPHVTSIDGDSLQLVYVDSFNATTAPFDAEDLTNTKFTFETSRMGNHYVSFAVSDNNGAYAMGLIEVPAFDPNKTGQWDGIFYQGVYFTAPLTIQEAAGKQITYNDTLVDNYYNPAVDLALFSAGNALNYCGLQGRLPTSEELTLLSSESVQTKHNWPISEQYMANDDGTYKTVDLTTGIVSEYLGGNYIVSCIEGGLTVQPPAEKTIANGVEEAEIVFTLLGQDEEPIVGPAINFTVQSDSNQAALVTLNEATDANGQATARVTNIKAEDVTVCGEVGIQNTCTIVTFVGDPATASIVSVTSDVLGWAPGDGTKYPIEALVEDINGNPVQTVVKNSNPVYSVVSHEEVYNGGEVQTPLLVTCNNCLETSDGLESTTNFEGVASWGVANPLETEYSDETHHTFYHTNTQGVFSSIDHKIYWGMWQWEEPIELRLTVDSATGYNSPTCAEFGGEWSDLTVAQYEEYNAAREAGDPRLFNIQTDPLTRVIQDHTIEGLAPRMYPQETYVQHGDVWKSTELFPESETLEVWFRLANIKGVSGAPGWRIMMYNPVRNDGVDQVAKTDTRYMDFPYFQGVKIKFEEGAHHEVQQIGYNALMNPQLHGLCYRNL
ncbi:TPA: Ig-like domain-containing protein [Vibrio campbellii]|uniref:Ig-like domain-containing protein n=1 Tax=Vibrio campbellii TaxID=680 RepID=UPI003909D5EA